MTRYNTLDEILPATAREDRQITFIEGESQQKVLTFRRLRQRALGVLGALQRRGLGPGDKVVLYVADNERFVELFWACVLGGIVPVPLAPGAAAEHLRKLWAVFGQLERASVCIDAPALERFEAFAADRGRAGRRRPAARAGHPFRCARGRGRPRPAASGRARPARLHPVFLGLDRRPQGRAADASQPLREHRLDQRGGRVFRSRRHAELDAAVPRHGTDRLSPQHPGRPGQPRADAHRAVRAPPAALARAREPDGRDGPVLAELRLPALPEAVRPEASAAARPFHGAPDLQRRRADLRRALPALHADAGVARPAPERDAHRLRPGRGQPRGQLPAPRRPAGDAAPGSRRAGDRRAGPRRPAVGRPARRIRHARPGRARHRGPHRRRCRPALRRARRSVTSRSAARTSPPATTHRRRRRGRPRAGWTPATSAWSATASWW